MMAAEEEAGEGEDVEAAADERLSARPAPGPGRKPNPLAESTAFSPGCTDRSHQAGLRWNSFSN